MSWVTWPIKNPTHPTKTHSAWRVVRCLEGVVGKKSDRVRFETNWQTRSATLTISPVGVFLILSGHDGMWDSSQEGIRIMYWEWVLGTFQAGIKSHGFIVVIFWSLNPWALHSCCSAAREYIGVPYCIIALDLFTDSPMQLCKAPLLVISDHFSMLCALLRLSSI